MSEINPSYYKRTINTTEIEVIDIIEAWDLQNDHYLATAIQYILRSAHKHNNSTVDISKAIWFLQRKLTKGNQQD